MYTVIVPRLSNLLPTLLICLLWCTPNSLTHGAIPAAEARPNIVWIIVDDMSADFSCYGQNVITTPHVDRLAERGTRFTNCYVTAPVCSTCRSAFITGMYQTAIGSHHHRSGRGERKIRLPDGVRMVPEMFQEAGYHTSLSSWPVGRRGRLGKSDYNFEWDQSVYDGNDWSSRSEGQPFFHQIMTPGGKLRGGTLEQARRFQQRCAETFGNSVSPDEVTLPPCYPRDPVLLEDYAAYLDSCRETDRVVGEIVARLEEEKILNETVIVFMTDHGISHARGKQFLYDEGLHVPLVIAGPGVGSGVTRSDLVEHIDIAALSLALAGIPIPPAMQARDILADGYQPRDAVFAARDRCDETVDHLRSVRTQRFKYIRNFLPDRPMLQPNAYKDKKDILIALRAARDAGTLSPLQLELLFADRRPSEELYDLQTDPHETRNLAEDPKFADELKKLRTRLNEWMKQSNDQGHQPESAEMYDSDMQVYLDGLRKRNSDPEHLRRIESNIALMKEWRAAGK